MFAALTAVIVGGMSMRGGEGVIWRTVVRVFFIAMVNSGLNLLAVKAVYTSIARGTLIPNAVTLDSVGRRRRVEHRASGGSLRA
jgi:ribose transport system permease protein